MNGISRFFLILLRVAIGWHFLFEGIDKVESMRRGVTETSRPFSSAGYLNESSGPMTQDNQRADRRSGSSCPRTFDAAGHDFRIQAAIIGQPVSFARAGEGMGRLLQSLF